jgi:capsular polysaccharide biosynthesis protein
MSQEMVPLDELKHLLRYWWVLVALVIVGGGLGWLVHSLRSPIYEARAAITVNINYDRSGELTDIEEDQAMEAVGRVISSTDVQETLLADLQSSGNPIPAAQWDSMHTLERTNALWVLIVHSADPQQAADLANAWADVAYPALEDALYHANQAETQQRYQDALMACIQPGASAGPLPDVCQGSTPEQIDAEIQQAALSVQQEQPGGRGLLPATLLAFNERAVVPQSPVRYAANTFVFAGGMIGFLLGITLLELNMPARLFKEQKSAS